MRENICSFSDGRGEECVRKCREITSSVFILRQKRQEELMCCLGSKQYFSVHFKTSTAATTLCVLQIMSDGPTSVHCGF